MLDKLEYINNSLVHHGSFNNRLFVLKLDESKNLDKSIKFFEEMAKKNKYTKIIIKAPLYYNLFFKDKNYVLEGFIPQYFKNNNDLGFFSKFIDKKRQIEDIKTISENLNIAKNKPLQNLAYPNDYKFKKFTPDMAKDLANLYSKVFNNIYPYPIFKKDYLLKTLEEGFVYFVTIYKDKIINACSIDTNLGEISDFATIPAHRGKNLSIFIAKIAEQEAKKQKMKLIFAAARSLSIGMNAIFSKSGYSYSGTLIKNTNISTGLESLNIWYKHI